MHTNHPSIYATKHHNINRRKSLKNTTCLNAELNTQKHNRKPRKTEISDKHNGSEQKQIPTMIRSNFKSRTAGTTSEAQMQQGTEVPSLDEHDGWGHQLSHKPSNTIRIILQHIGSIDIHH